MLVVSPLTRALHTAELAFPSFLGPRVVEALTRERVYLSSDAGRAPSELAGEFPGYKFDHLDDIWWYNGGSRDPTKVRGSHIGRPHAKHPLPVPFLS